MKNILSQNSVAFVDLASIVIQKQRALNRLEKKR